MNELFPFCANKQVIRILGKLQRALPAKFNRLPGILIAITQRPVNENSIGSVLFVRLQIKVKYLSLSVFQ